MKFYTQSNYYLLKFFVFAFFVFITILELQFKCLTTFKLHSTHNLSLIHSVERFLKVDERNMHLNVEFSPFFKICRQKNTLCIFEHPDLNRLCFSSTKGLIIIVSKANGGE